MLFRPPGFYASNLAAMGGAEEFALADISVGLYDAANLASQEDSLGAPPDPGDQVYAVADIATTPTWGDLARVNTGPDLAQDGTSYFWNNANGTRDGFGRTYSPGSTLVDLFVVMRATGADAAGYVMSTSNAATWYVGHYEISSSSTTFSAGSGTPTFTIDGAAPATRDAAYDALLNTWSLVRVANINPTTWTSFSVLGLNTGADWSLVAVVPSSVVATGSNLANINAAFNARIAELNA